MIEKLKDRLNFLGVQARAGDEDFMEKLLGDAERDILAEIGLVSMPNELESMAIDLAAGSYLLFLKSSGQMEGFDAEAAIKQLQEGDTSVTYAVGSGSLTPEERLDTIIRHLMTIPPSVAAAWRRLRW